MDWPKDDFKWFGQGFDGFPKSLPEDCVEYALYIIDSKLSDFDVREKLREVQSEANRLTEQLLEGFIWQRESFALDLIRGNGKVQSFLGGRTNYGDSVNDEWLIVHILREISKRFPHLWIRVVDTDGQFLLIEAANALPRWLNPEIADFRVWINNGKLMIIPITRLVEGHPEIRSAEPSQAMTLEEALDALRNSPSKLLHLPSVEGEAFYRLQQYPKQIADSLHHALIQIPRKLAYILHENAAYISPAIEAFYLRDPIATRPLYASDATKWMLPPIDLVTVSVKFTKVGYAQVKSQQFAAPPAWSGVLPTDHDRSLDRAEIGMKVTNGFEMLISDPQNKDLKVVREIKLLLEDIETGEDRLPSDIEISKWKSDEDDEGWLDINFEQFEQELAGKGPKGLSVDVDGFGDKATQGNLRKMVERFGDFLNDDAAGAEGAEYLDDMDKDNDSDHGSSENGNEVGEDSSEEITFDADKFATLMRDIIGNPQDRSAETRPEHERTSDTKKPDFETGHASEDEDEEGEIQKVMRDMELELRSVGALRLDHASAADTTKPSQQVIDAGAGAVEFPSHVADGGSDTEDDDLNIDYNLAKNMLESFKNQGGGAGPGGNLMGMMGMHLPRDEGDSLSNPRQR